MPEKKELINLEQGILTILLGIYLLADEIPLFGRIRDGLEHRFPRAASFVHKQKQKLHDRFHKEKPEDISSSHRPTRKNTEDQ